MNGARLPWLRITLTVGATLIAVAAMSVVGQAGANVFKEFAPELKRLIPRRKPSPRNEPQAH